MNLAPLLSWSLQVPFTAGPAGHLSVRSLPALLWGGQPSPSCGPGCAPWNCGRSLPWDGVLSPRRAPGSGSVCPRLSPGPAGPASPCPQDCLSSSPPPTSPQGGKAHGPMPCPQGRELVSSTHIHLPGGTCRSHADEDRWPASQRTSRRRRGMEQRGRKTACSLPGGKPSCRRRCQGCPGHWFVKRAAHPVPIHRRLQDKARWLPVPVFQ